MTTGHHEDSNSNLQPQVVRLQKPQFLQSTLRGVVFASYTKLPLLDEVPTLEAQQALLVTDIFYGLLGYEGSYFKYSDRYDPRLIHHRIAGPDHNVAKHIDVSLKKVTKKLLRYGKMYSALLNFCMIYNMPVFGRANHRLCHEILNLLRTYRTFIASYQEIPPRGSRSLTAIDNAIQKEMADKLNLMYEIACLIHIETEERNPLFRSATDVAECLTKDFGGRDPRFSTFLESIRNDIDSAGSYIGVSSDSNKFEVCKGGCVLRIVQSKIAQYNGDRVSSSFLSETFEAISKDYINLLNLWLSRGEVNDPFQEFLIKKNDLPGNIFYSNMERYWEELYVIKNDGLINHFTSKDMQIKLLSTGKFLNIFRLSIGRASLEGVPDATFLGPTPKPIVSLYSKDLTFKINQFYSRANKVLLKMFFKGYYFNDLLSNLHRTFLLNDSYRIDCFLDASYHDLTKEKKPSSVISTKLSFDTQFSTSRTSDTCHYGRVNNIIKEFSTFTVDDNNFYDLAEEIINIKSFDTEEAIKENEHASHAIKKFVSQSLQRAPPGLREAKSAANLAGTEELLHAKANDSVIEGVNINVSLPFPLNLLVGESFIFEYQLIFRLQMILKFTSKLLDNCWKDISFSSVWNYKGYSRPTRKLMLRCRVLVFRMKSLLVELQSYINFSIIEANYSVLRHTSEQFQKESEADASGQQTSSTRLSLSNSALSMQEGHSSPSSQSPARADYDLRWSSQNEPHFFMKQAFTANDIFDEKILGSSHGRISKSKTKEKYTEVSELNNQIGKYLNNILRDSMITNGLLLQLLRGLLNTVHLFGLTVTRLKKTFILMNAQLLQEYKTNYPDKFERIEFSESLMNSRVAGLNEVVTGFWSRFNEGLGEMTNELDHLGGENPAFVALQEIFARV